MATAPVPLHLVNHEKVTEAFGYWPMFHDAEVRSIELDRNRTLFDSISNPCINITIHALEWTEAKAEATSTFNHHLVHLKFEEVSDVRLEGFNHQNAIYGATFEPAQSLGDAPRHRLTLDGAHGLSASFTYARGGVASVIPCSDLGAPRW